MRSLYPPIEPFDSFELPVSDLHTIYVEQCGNPAGKPALFVHGGPGGGLDPAYRRFFDPQRWRLVLFDQRGAGRSRPFAELRENDTWHLVEDMETIRQRLAIERWTLFGGSWGSTLSLAYAQRHPQRVSALILRGIFLLRKLEIDWFYQHGASLLFPDAWQDYLRPIAPEERHDLVGAYYRRLCSEDSAVRMEAARAWSMWEGRLSKLQADADFIARFGADRFAEAFARIECHYFIHRGFLQRDDQLLQGARALAGIPGAIVHGRYDVVCPLDSAWQLHQAWPGSELHITPDAGHSALEPGNLSKLVELTDRFAQQERPA
ncbi:MAG: prolyl aminopeptidase [Leptospirales bacterium]|nr:prolyl aminopeptidase [Leptospirales bacterium]